MTDTGPVEVFNAVLGETSHPWVLFEHGTCVRFGAPSLQPAEEAKSLLRSAGPVIPGTPMADFSTFKLKNFPGWLVTGYHPDIFTYVSPTELPEAVENNLQIGLFGRHKRDCDARELNIVHVAGGQ